MTLKYQDSIQPRDLVGYDGPLFVKSNTKSLMSFDDLKNKLTLRPDEIAILDRKIAENPGFQKFWRSGRVYVFKDDPTIDNEMTDQELRLREAAKARDEASAAMIQKIAGSDDLTSLDCLECGDPVFQKQEDRDVQPPLCSDHSALESMWAFSKHLDQDTGEIVKKWKPVKIVQ